jgi:TolB-like protein
VDYSRLTGIDEEGTHNRVMEILDNVSQKIGSSGGTVLRYSGDAVLATFPSVVQAVIVSIDIQNGLAVDNESVAEESQVEIRIGVNLGDVIEDRGEIFGDGVNLAARLETAAHPGGICISSTVWEQCQGKIDSTFADGGEQQFKNIARPVNIFHWQPGTAQPSINVPNSDSILSNKTSIAVLPFNNMSGDDEQEYFSDGISEDIITELSRFKNLFVCARHSSFTFKGKTVDVKTAGRELGAHYIVEGSVRKVGNRVRVTVQLVSADSGSHIWAERYDRDLDDIFAVQDEVVSSVVAQLGMSLRREAMEFARGRPTDSLTAYDNLLHARAAWWRGEWNKGFTNTQSALEADPGYAQAHAWMALQYAHQTYSRSMRLNDEEICIGAKRHAEEALRLNDQDPFIHMAASMAFRFTPVPDRHRGLRHSDISYAMNPHDFDVLYCRAFHLTWSERPLEALACLKRLEDLNPLAGFMLGECYADAYYLLERYEDCLNCYQDRGEASNQVKVLMAASLAKLDRIEEARSYVDELRRHDPDYDVEGCARGIIALCVSDQDAERLRVGFRLSGVSV